MAATVPSLKITKTFTYRGAARNFSNRHYFSGGIPTGPTQWTALADAVVLLEKACYNSADGTQIVLAQGFLAGSDVAVWSKTYATAGTWVSAAYPRAVGDAAALLRWSTADRSTKNHPIYAFSYIHSVYGNALTDGDTLQVTQKANLDIYAAAWVTGFSDGAHTLKRCTPQGHVATGYVTAAKLHHRDFPAA